jgi:hypothetical protein
MGFTVTRTTYQYCPEDDGNVWPDVDVDKLELVLLLGM